MFIRTIVINYLLNVASKKEMVYLFIYFLSFSKRVCRSVHTECCEHEVIYKQQDIKGSIS